MHPFIVAVTKKDFLSELDLSEIYTMTLYSERNRRLYYMVPNEKVPHLISMCSEAREFGLLWKHLRFVYCRGSNNVEVRRVEDWRAMDWKACDTHDINETDYVRHGNVSINENIG